MCHALGMQRSQELSPLGVRLAAYLVMVLVALLAIRVIDGHVMAKTRSLRNSQEPEHVPTRSAAPPQAFLQRPAQ